MIIVPNHIFIVVIVMFCRAIVYIESEVLLSTLRIKILQRTTQSLSSCGCVSLTTYIHPCCIKYSIQKTLRVVNADTFCDYFVV